MELYQQVANRVKQAREARGLDFERAAKLLAVDVEHLQSIEDATHDVDVSELTKLAKVYGVSTRYFISSQEADFEGTDSTHFLLRSSGLNGHKFPPELYGFEDFARHLLHIVDITGETLPQPNLPTIEFTDDETPTVEQAVHALKEHWGLDNTPIAPRLFDLLEENHLLVYREPVLDTTIAGAYWELSAGYSLIFVNAKDIPWRQVFTAAHELAHALFHQSTAIQRYSQPEDSNTQERLANAFAAELLMPKSVVNEMVAEIGSELTPFDVVDLQRYFGVSYTAMLNQLFKLNHITHSQGWQFESRKVKPVKLASKLGYHIRPWEFDYSHEKAGTSTRLTWLPRAYVRLVRKANEEQELLTERKTAAYLNLEFEAWSAFRIAERNALKQTDNYTDEDVENLLL